MIKLYVDDLTLAIRADPAKVIRMMVTIINFDKNVLETIQNYTLIAKRP